MNDTDDVGVDGGEKHLIEGTKMREIVGKGDGMADNDRIVTKRAVRRRTSTGCW